MATISTEQWDKRRRALAEKLQAVLNTETEAVGRGAVLTVLARLAVETNWKVAHIRAGLTISMMETQRQMADEAKEVAGAKPTG